MSRKGNVDKTILRFDLVSEIVIRMTMLIFAGERSSMLSHDNIVYGCSDAAFNVQNKNKAASDPPVTVKVEAIQILCLYYIYVPLYFHIEFGADAEMLNSAVLMFIVSVVDQTYSLSLIL